jgi:multiple sugar transport system substrate-binding protein
MKRLLAMVTVLAMLLTCAVIPAASAEDVVELTVWHTWGAGAGLDAMTQAIEQFNDTVGKEKGIHVSNDYVASKTSGNTQTMEKLMAAIASGDAPDIALLDNFQVASWAAQNALTPLDDLMAGVDLTLDGMYDWAKQGSIYQGSTYSIPYNGDVRALYCNMDLFAAAGLTEADIPRTIDQLNDVAQKLTIKDDNGGFSQVGFIPWASAGKPIYTWGWAFGGSFYDQENNVLTVNQPQIIEAVQWEHDFASQFGLSDFVEFANGAISGSGATDPFVAGKVAMIIKGNWDIANIAAYNPDMNYTISYIPTKDESLVTTWAGGWGYTIPRGSKHPQQAIEFLKYMAGEEDQTIMATVSGSLSPVMDVNDAVFSGNPRYDVILQLIPYAQIRPSVPVGQLLWDSFNTVLDNVLYEKGTPENELNALYTSINAELADY